MKKTVILTAMAFLFALFLIPGFSHAQEKTALNQRLGSRLYDSEVSEAFSTGEGDDGILLVQMRPPRRSPRPIPPPRPRRPRYQEPRRTFGFGGRLTVSNYSGDEFSYAPYNIDADFDNGFGFGGNFTLFPVPFFPLNSVWIIFSRN